MATSAAGIHRWTRQEYQRMVDVGLFRPDERTELVDGVVYSMTPQSSGHTTALHLAAEALRPAFPGSYLRVQAPLVLDGWSEPEPDVAAVSGNPRDYRDAHPTTALLVVEVADSSLRHDRLRKLPLYARAGIPEAWILDLGTGALEVYRDPAPEGYRSRTVLRRGDRVSPLSRPEATLAVTDLLP